jgi:hypothetical protein
MLTYVLKLPGAKFQLRPSPVFMTYTAERQTPVQPRALNTSLLATVFTVQIAAHRKVTRMLSKDSLLHPAASV